MEEIKKTDLGIEGQQRRSLVKAGAVAALGAILGGLGIKKRAERTLAEMADQTKKRVEAEETAEAAKTAEAQKYAPSLVKEKPTPAMSREDAIRVTRELEGKLDGLFSVSIMHRQRSRVVVANEGVNIRGLPSIGEKTKIGAFSKNEETPGLLAVASVVDSEGIRYEWGVFRYEELKERDILFKERKPTVSISDWGEVVFACLQKGNEAYMMPSSEKK